MPRGEERIFLLPLTPTHACIWESRMEGEIREGEGDREEKYGQEAKRRNEEVCLSVERKREVMELLSVGIISPSRTWKRGASEEEHA